MTTVSEKKFSKILRSTLGADWDRALKTFQNYGPTSSFDITNVLFSASKQNKVSEVLDILEEHYQSHLQYQHPEIRGLVRDALMSVNKTEVMFLDICERILGLKPQA